MQHYLKVGIFFLFKFFLAYHNLCIANLRVYEDEESVILVNMKFDRDKYGAYQALVSAEVGPSKEVKSYEWTIRDAPKLKYVMDYDSEDKDVFMIANFGTKLVKFVAKRRKGLRTPGQGEKSGKVIRNLNMPFRPVIFADGQYAIFDDMAGFKVTKFAS